MINLKKLRKVLETHIMLAGKVYVDHSDKRISQRINIKRKKKMIIEEAPNGRVRVKRRNVIKIEIIE